MAGPGQARFYSSTFVQTQLAAAISSSTLTFNVGVTTGAPGTPFVISVDQNTSSEELMLVTNVAGVTYTVTRGIGGTTAQAHALGASVVHVMYAQDLTDAGAHIGTYDGVHGLQAGSLVVGESDIQTLFNKTLQNPVLNSPTINTPAISGATTSGSITSNAEITAVDFVATGLTGATLSSRYVGGTSGGAPASGTFSTGDFVIDENGTTHVCTAGGSPGTWSTSVTTTGTQTLTNKTLGATTVTGLITSSASPTALTASGAVNSSSSMSATEFTSTGLTGATAASRYVGATNSGAPTSGTFSNGDFIIDRSGSIWVCSIGGTPGTWVPLDPAATSHVGPGFNTNVMASGGANRTSSQQPFVYSTQATVTVGAGSAWSFTSSGVTFHGCGSFSVTPGSNTNALGFLTIVGANCNISSGNLTLAGAAFTNSAAGVGNGLSIVINITANAW